MDNHHHPHEDDHQVPYTVGLIFIAVLIALVLIALL